MPSRTARWTSSFTLPGTCAGDIRGNERGKKQQCCNSSFTTPGTYKEQSVMHPHQVRSRSNFPSSRFPVHHISPVMTHAIAHHVCKAALQGGAYPLHGFWRGQHACGGAHVCRQPRVVLGPDDTVAGRRLVHTTHLSQWHIFMIQFPPSQGITPSLSLS